MNTEAKKKFIINFAFFVMVAALLYFVLKFAIGWFMPFIIGLIVALIVQKPVEFLTRKTRLPRTLWALIAVALFFALVLALVVFPCISIYNGIGRFVLWIQDNLPEFKQNITAIGDGLDNWIDKLPNYISDQLSGYPQKILEGAAKVVATLASGLAKGIITYFPSTMLSGIITVVASCFITVYYGKIRKFFLCQFSEKNQQIIMRVKEILVENVLKMIGGYILILFITFIELLIGMLILGVPYAGVVALIIAVFDILPVVGTGTILIPWFLIDMALGNTAQGIGVIVIYLVITIIRNVIEPKIIGERLGLFPLVTLISLYLGLKLFGLYGMVLFPLTIVVLIQLQKAGIIHIWNTPEKEEHQEQNDVFSVVKSRLLTKKTKKGTKSK